MSYADLDAWRAHCANSWARLASTRTRDALDCTSCGYPLAFDGEHLQCTLICHNCGAKRDCTDP